MKPMFCDVHSWMALNRNTSVLHWELLHLVAMLKVYSVN